MKKMYAPLLALPVLVSAPLLMQGCGGSNQDVGEASTAETRLSGRVIDGYVARATVFLDTNNNGTRDPWEDFAFTDNEGYYSRNPNTGVDYCASNATVEDAQYCLRTSREFSNVVVRADSGYDTLSNEPFLGQMSRRVEMSEADSMTVISPITTLVSHAEDDAQQTSVLSALNLGLPDLDVDYLNSNGADAVNSHLLNTATKIHKTVTVLSERLTDTYTAIGEDFGTPNDASSVVYRALANDLVEQQSGAEALSDTRSLTNVLQSAAQHLSNIYEQRELEVPPGLSTAEQQDIAIRASGVSQVVDSLIDRHKSDYSQSEVKGRFNAIELVTMRASDAQGTSMQELVDTVNFFTDSQDPALVDAVVQTLGEPNGDLTNLEQHDFQYMTSPEDIAAVARTADSAEAFSFLSGKRLRISDPDLGQAPNALKDSEVELYFEGQADALSGPLTACIKYIDDANQNGDMGEGSTRGERVTGSWSLLGATADEPSSYNIVLTLKFLNARYQAIIKAAGTEMVDGELQHKLRFDHKNEISTWFSEQGLQPLDHTPETSADCRERLPSRIGL